MKLNLKNEKLEALNKSPSIKKGKSINAESMATKRATRATVKVWGLSGLAFAVPLILGILSTRQILILGQAIPFSLVAPFSLDRLVALGLIFALVPPSIFYILETRRKDAIDNNLPSLLQDVAEAGSLGMTLIRAMEVSTERNYGPLTKELKKMVAQLSWGAPLDNALKSFALRCGTLLTSRVAFLIQAAYKTGGDVQESIETINLHVQEIQNQERKRKMEMRPYIGIIYLSFFVFLITSFFLVTQFFNVSGGGMMSAAMSVGGFRNPSASKEVLTPIFFYMAMVEGIFSGLAGGKISTGSIKNGFIHSVLLCAISFVVFTFYVK